MPCVSPSKRPALSIGTSPLRIAYAPDASCLILLVTKDTVPVTDTVIAENIVVTVRLANENTPETTVESTLNGAAMMLPTTANTRPKTPNKTVAPCETVAQAAVAATPIALNTAVPTFSKSPNAMFINATEPWHTSVTACQHSAEFLVMFDQTSLATLLMTCVAAPARLPKLANVFCANVNAFERGDESAERTYDAVSVIG